MEEFLNKANAWIEANCEPVIITLCVLSILLTAGIIVAYMTGRNQAISAAVIAENAKYDEKYQELTSKVEDKQAELDEANATIAKADTIQNGIDDLNKEHDDLETQVKDKQSELDLLTKQVDDARKHQITNGVWQIGTDIEAGTYRTTSAVSGQCYWEITSNDAIVSNDIPGGGFPQVTLAAGQQFKSQDCGDWAKQ